jgi:hypothetical protein
VAAPRPGWPQFAASRLSQEIDSARVDDDPHRLFRAFTLNVDFLAQTGHDGIDKSIRPYYDPRLRQDASWPGCALEGKPCAGPFHVSRRADRRL